MTFSFDDGNEDDVRLVRIMNSYGLKGTFNLNSGSLTKTVNWKYDGFSTDLESYLSFPGRSRPSISDRISPEHGANGYALLYLGS